MTESLHILCFGASLTAGATRIGSGLIFHPYGRRLKTALEVAFPAVNITIDVQGLSGDQVCSPPGGFQPRMEILYEEADEPYTHAVILGGTNDLADGRGARDIYAALKAVWAIPLSHSSSVLALTIPECPFQASRRTKINAAILEREAENFHTFDFASKIPYDSMPEQLRKEVWDDDVHFTAKGYNLMGDVIAERLVGIVAQEKGWAIEDRGDVELKSEDDPKELKEK